MKRLFAFLLALILLAGSIPAVSVSATLAEEIPALEEAIIIPADETEVISDETSSNVVISGKCGDNLTFVLDDAGTLTISGNGPMWDYGEYHDNSWEEEYRDFVKAVVIEDGVTSIGECAFDQLNSQFTSLTIGKDVQSIGYRAVGTSNIPHVFIPAKVQLIGDRAFAGITTFTVDTENAYFSNDSYGVLFNKEKTKLLCLPSLGVDSYTIPEGVVRIENGAAYGNTLKEVILPNSLQTIGNEAFCCAELRKIHIPSQVTSIGEEAFWSCDNLTEVHISGSVVAIGAYAFDECKNLTKIQVNESNQNYSSDDKGVLFNKSQTTLIQMPGGISGEYTVPSSTTTIQANAGDSCQNLTELIISDNVTTIGICAFDYCKNLKKVTLGKNVKTIGNLAFGNAAIEEITFPACLRTIGESAFSSCEDLKKIVFTGNAPQIEGDAFDEVVATVYYPANNTTYTASVMKNYCGELTWVPMEVEPTDPPEPTDPVDPPEPTDPVDPPEPTDPVDPPEPTDPVDPPEPTDPTKPKVTLSYSTKGYPVLKWEKVEGAKKYQVYYATAEDGTYKKLTTTSKLTYTHSKAGSGKEYFYKVRVYGKTEATAGTFSDVIRAVKTLSAPKLTLSTKQSSGKITVKWKKITGATSYVLQCSVNGGEFTTIATTASRSYVHTGLSDGNIYKYRLMAKSAVEDAASAWSAEKSVVFACGKPVVTVRLDENEKPAITWKAIPGAAKYEIYRSTSKSGGYWLIASTEGTAWIDSDAPVAKTCYYKVRAVSAYGTPGKYSSVKSVTTRCHAPTGVSVTANGKGKPVISWEAAEGAKKYEVYYATSPDGKYKKLTTTSKLTYTHSKAKAGKTYYYIVRAYGKSTSSRGEYSPVVSMCVQ